MTVRGHAYERRGLLAIDPKAFWEVFFADDASGRENVEQGDCVIVDVRGPLEQHAHPWCDSYESILARVRAACGGSARAVVLRFDSPGGDAAGCFEAADELRELVAAAGKQLHAYVDGDCCSAAYALACAAQSITISQSALVGSIGVLSCRDDVSARNAANGLRVALIASGARKTDGHPDQPISDAELANTQQLVDSMASVFFDLVARSRPVLTVDAVARLEAKVFHGMQAVGVGLADAVGSLTTVLARVAGVATGDTKMAGSAYEKARALLQEAAEGDDANASAAKRALAALEPGEGDKKKEGEPDGDESAEGEPADPAAEGSEPDKQAEGEPPASDDKKAAKAAASSAYRAALKAQNEVTQLRAELRQRDERDERQKLIASRPGLAPEMVALLEKAPIELVRETIAAQPAGGARSNTLARAAVRGEDQGDERASRLPPAEKAALDTRMGLVTEKPGVEDSTFKLTLGVRRPISQPEKAS